MKQLKMKFQNLKKTRLGFKTLASLLFILFLFKGAPAGNTPANVVAQISVLSPEESYSNDVRSLMNTKLIEEVERYINNLAPGNRIHASYLVEKCQQYEMDVIFVIAQGILESHLGTRGKAFETNSP
jgi:hypothetical protein